MKAKNAATNQGGECWAKSMVTAITHTPTVRPDKTCNERLQGAENRVMVGPFLILRHAP